MLKGHVFKKQIFGNQMFALFINTFLDGANGISNDYKNKMAVTYSGSTLTVQSGAVCIQGRFLEEDTSTDISAGTDTSYCKLVIEIDLDKQNTETDFLQGAYKVIKSASAYPSLTQQNIVGSNSGVYQYELARFRTSTNGITDFTDMRTYLDFDSIYSAIRTEYRAILSQLQQELASVEDGSAYVLKNNIAIVTGSVQFTVSQGSTEISYTSGDISYPNSFSKDNCAVLNVGLLRQGMPSNVGFGYGTLATTLSPGALLSGVIGKGVILRDTGIQLRLYYNYNATTSEDIVYTFDYKIVLMKI